MAVKNPFQGTFYGGYTSDGKPALPLPTLGVTAGATHGFDPNVSYNPEQRQQVLDFVKKYNSGAFDGVQFATTPWGQLSTAFLGQRIMSELQNPSLQFTNDFAAIQKQFQDRYDSKITEEQQRYSDTIGRLNTANTALGSGLTDAVGTQQDASNLLGTEYSGVRTGMQSADDTLNSNLASLGTAYGTRESNVMGRYDPLESAYGTGLDAVKSGYGTRESNVMGRYDPLAASYGTGLDSVKSGYETRESNVMSRFNPLESAYGSKLDAVATSAADRQAGVLGRYDTVGTAYGNALDGVVEGYTNRENAVMGNFNQYGDQARNDILNRYSQQRESADQDLTSRGMGNTTVRSSVMSGVNSQQAQDVGRFDQDLSRQRADLLGSLRGDKLAAQSAAVQGKADFGAGGANLQSQLWNDTNAAQTAAAQGKMQVGQYGVDLLGGLRGNVLDAQTAATTGKLQAGQYGADLLGSLRSDMLGAQNAAVQGKAQFGAAGASLLGSLRGDALDRAGQTADSIHAARIASQQAAERFAQQKYASRASLAGTKKDAAESLFSAAGEIAGYQERRKAPEAPSLQDIANLQIQGGFNPADRRPLSTGLTITGTN